MGRDARFYPINGRELPSVTTVLGVIDKSGPLMHWSANMERRAFETALLNVLADKTKTRDQVLDAVIGATNGTKAFLKEQDKAAAIGTAAHAYVEWLTRKMLGEKVGPEPQIPDASMIAVESWKDWARDVDFTPLMVERVVYCLECGYAGTLDWIGKVRGLITLGDLKTSKGIYPEMFLQARMYRHAAKRNGIDVEQCIVLRLPKTLADPTFEVMPCPDVPMSVPLGAIELWRWLRQIEGKKT